MKLRLNLLWGTYAVSCVIIVMISYIVERNLEASQQLHLESEFTKAQDLLVEKVDSFVHGLQGMGGLYISKNFDLSPQEIETYARFRNNFDNFPGALGFGFIRVVPREQKSAYERAMRLELPNFSVVSLEENQHENLFVIETIEPIARNQMARGLDVGSESIRREAALRAIDSGRSTLTGAVQLVQTEKKQTGFLYFLPLYKTQMTPSNLEVRRKEIAGFAYSPILLAPLMEYLEGHSTARLHYSIFDVTNTTPTLLHQGRDFKEESGEGKSESFSSVFEVGGRQWQIEARHVKESLLLASQAIAVFVGIIMWLLTSILFMSLHRQQQRRLKQETNYNKISSLQTAILDASTYSIISTDLDGIITTFNHAAEKLLGYDEREMVGKRTPAIIHLEQEVVSYAATLSQQYQTTILPGFDVFIYRSRLEGSDTKEWTYVRKDQSTFPIRLTTTVLKNSEQEIVGYLGVAEDLTREKTLQETVERQRAQILSSAKMSALGEMAAGVSHEINNPLAIISGTASVMEFQLESDGKLEGEFAQSQLTKIQKTVERIARIVQGLRNFSRESSSDQSKAFEIHHLVQETLAFCQERFRVHGVALSVDVQDSLWVHGNLTQLSQVLLNLLNNSYDAILALPEKWIKVQAWKEGGIISLSVTDS